MIAEQLSLLADVERRPGIDYAIVVGGRSIATFGADDFGAAWERLKATPGAALQKLNPRGVLLGLDVERRRWLPIDGSSWRFPLSIAETQAVGS